MFKRAALKNHPRELWILALTELCERFAFWGVGNLLVLFLIEYYQFTNVKATHIYGVFTGFAAFLPLIGGYIADRWNYQSPMLIGALINALGCFMLSTGHPWLLYPSLFVIALGYGIFTPSILTVLGFSYKSKPHLRESGFSIYYASINVGVFLALLSLGSIAKLASWNTAFFTAGIVQLLGLCPLFWYLSKHKDTMSKLHTMQKAGQKQTEKLTFIEIDRLKVIGIFCLFSILFWIAYNQAFSSMEIFAHQFMNKQVDGHLIPEGVFLSSESFFLILLAPLLAVLYGMLAKLKKDPSPAIKTAFSFLFMTLCFCVMMIACNCLAPEATEGSVSWTYLVGAYFFMAVGEMLLAPVGLSMISHLSPPRYIAGLIGLWYVCVGFAFYIGGVLAGLMGSVGGLYNFFSIFVLMSLIPAIGMFLFAKKITKLSHIHMKEGPIEPH
jgi:POT family proton-dependent oligopeptide transporter